MSRVSDRRFLVIFALGLLFAYIPVFLISTKEVLNSNSWKPGVELQYYPGFTEKRRAVPQQTYGYVGLEKGSNLEYWVVGKMQDEDQAWASWGINIWHLPFLREEIGQRNASLLSASLILDGMAPISNISDFEIKSVGWQDDDFTSGWELQPYSAKFSRVSTEGGVITFTGNLSSSRDYYRLTKYLPKALSTSDYSYLFTRYKSSDRIAYFGAWNGPNGILPAGFSRYSNDAWRTIIFRLPENQTINRIEIGIDDFLKPQIDGLQTVSFDYIMLISADVKASHAQIAFNYKPLFNEELSFPAYGEDLFTINSSKYSVEGDIRISLPIDVSLLKVANHVNVSVEKYTSWKISRVSIRLNIINKNPFWYNYVPQILLAFGIEVVVTSIMLKRLSKWLTKRS